MRLLPYFKHSTETKGMLGGTQYLWEQGRSNLARDSWNFSAKIHPLGKKQAKPAGSHIFIFSSNMLLVKQQI